MIKNFYKKLIITGTFGILVLMMNPAHAWNGFYHQVIMAIAYDQLSLTQQRQLKIALDDPYLTTAEILKSAAWLDQIRNKKSRAYHRTFAKEKSTLSFFKQEHSFSKNHFNLKQNDNYATWHYIDLAYQPGVQVANRLSQGLQAAQVLQQLEQHPSSNTLRHTYALVKRLLPRAPDHENVVWAIHLSLEKLNNKNLSIKQHEFYIKALLHLVGDIHQPLHCIELYNSEFPQGDRGGNLFMIRYSGANNLHALWDRALGLHQIKGKPKKEQYMQQIFKLAKTLEQQYPKAHFASQLKETAVKTWADNSHQLAIKYAYVLPVNSKPSYSYLKQGQDIAAEQLALAGYRLAQLLQQALR